VFGSLLKSSGAFEDRRAFSRVVGIVATDGQILAGFTAGRNRLSRASSRLFLRYLIATENHPRGMRFLLLLMDHAE